MLKYILFGLAILSTSSALAQQPQGQPQSQGQPEVLGLQAKLVKEFNDGIQCTIQFIALQQHEAKLSADLSKAQARIKELEAKHGEKK